MVHCRMTTIPSNPQPLSPFPTATTKAAKSARAGMHLGSMLTKPQGAQHPPGGLGNNRLDTTRDTVKLSGGHDIVNLARGQELADQMRNAPVDEGYASDLFKAGQDIFRISRLFNETLKAISRFWR